MVHEAVAATHAVVTLDVGLPGIVWPWFVTMNMWAKSIGTGVIFMLFYLQKRHGDDSAVATLRFPVAVISIVFITVFLLFTLADLHQPFRMWHIFFYPHWTSPITIGAIMASVFMGLISLLAFFSFIKKDDAAYDKLLLWTMILAIPVTLYTAALLSMCTARELWQMPTETVQMMLAALLAGSATIILYDAVTGSKMKEESIRSMAIILGLTAATSFTIYMAEYIFGPMKAEEVAVILEAVKGHGEYATMFWIGQVFAYMVPMVLVLLSVINRSNGLLKLAALSAIVGLWIVKHVWLIIPQLLPMS